MKRLVPGVWALVLVVLVAFVGAPVSGGPVAPSDGVVKTVDTAAVPVAAARPVSNTFIFACTSAQCSAVQWYVVSGGANCDTEQAGAADGLVQCQYDTPGDVFDKSEAFPFNPGGWHAPVSILD